ncbi:hypothetical protein B0H16DRAFT_1458904 [Mycena metata]|uniref:Uncharacterized protein n=1 Tax=Mycena metata TaxID=1033252 RepID=A0AAD7J1F1_9AGAR|nr:hypothetical protein B0H16DRAFT_1458904 [Mycena metata]
MTERAIARPSPSRAPGNLPLYAISSGSSSPVLITQSRAPSPVPASPSPPPYARRPLTPRPVYAVRVDREGAIFTTFRAAWARHRLLERQGRTPVLVVATSVVHALDWIDTAPLAEEYDVVFREILEEAIAVYRQDDHDNSLDDSRSVEEDGSRPMVATAELVEELDAREMLQIHPPWLHPLRAMTAKGNKKRKRTEWYTASTASFMWLRPCCQLTVGLSTGYDPDDPAFTGVTADGPAAIKIKGRKVYDNSTHPIKTWIPKRDQYADALIQREGRACVARHHRDEPLHILQEWQDGFFHSRGSKDLGLRFQIGHRKGEDCPLVPLTPVNDFVVLDNNGSTALECWLVPRDQQGPADGGNTQPVAPLPYPEPAGPPSGLRLLQQLGVTAKWIWPAGNSIAPAAVHAYGPRISPSPDVQKSGADPRYQRTSGDGSGRACGSQPCMSSTSWIYRLLVSEDANFKMKGRDRSSRDKDPTLGPGWAYMVANDDYLKHLVQYVDQDEISHCVSFAALWSANNKRAKGLRASGVSSVSCSRHELFRPRGMGDLQKGENNVHNGPNVESVKPRHVVPIRRWQDLAAATAPFEVPFLAMPSDLSGPWIFSLIDRKCQLYLLTFQYSNMDYLFFSSLIGITLLTVVASYNIACQWSRNFWARASAMPAYLKLPAGLQMLFKVPKFHLPPHVKSCHGPYSSNYTKGVGQTDGEGVERNWLWLNCAAQSISVVGPGSRDDTINDLCGFSNWRKTVDLGEELILRKLVLAIPQAMIHSRAFHAFTDGLQREHTGELHDWDALIREWEGNPLEAAINPFDYPVVEDDGGCNEEDFRGGSYPGGKGRGGRVAGEAGGILTGGNPYPGGAVPDCAVIFDTANYRQIGCCVGGETSHEDNHSSDRLAVQTDGAVGQAQQDPPLAAPDNSKPETIKIFLPSSLPAAARETVCLPQLAQNEEDLQQAQAGDALRDLRSNLRTRTFAHQFKRKNMGGQGMYKPPGWHRRSHPKCVGALSGGVGGTLGITGPWRLADSLMMWTSMGEPIPLTVLFNLETGEGTRQSSWLWYSAMGVGEVGADGKLHADIRVEWSKARARADCWREEVILVEEEMRRTIQYSLAEGLLAYGLEQVARERAWAETWGARWEPVRARAALVLKDHVEDVDEQVFAPIEVDLEEDVREDYEFDDFNDEEA